MVMYPGLARGNGSLFTEEEAAVLKSIAKFLSKHRMRQAEYKVAFRSKHTTDIKGRTEAYGIGTY